MGPHVGRVEILEFIQKIILAIVDSKDHVMVRYDQGEQTTVYTIDVHKDDLGKVLGRKGQNIEAVRTMVMAIASKHELRAVVLVEE